MILKPVTLETLPVNYVLHRKIRISAQAEAVDIFAYLLLLFA